MPLAKMSNYPNGFRNGVNIRGLPVLNTYGGNIWWVDSGAGADGNPGTFDLPFATLDYAVGRCTANNGDIIMVKAGHAESLTADSAVDVDVAGVTIVGLGTGADRPTFTFTTAVAADFKLAAANVTIQNLLFVAGIDALTGPIEVSGDDCAIIDCEYQDDATNNYETTDVIVTASTPLRMLIDGFKYVQDGGTGGTQNQSVIQLNGADFAIIRNCWLVADSGTGVIEDATVSDQIMIENCVVENSETSPTVAIFLQATTTGTIRNTNLRVASGTTYLTATNDMQLFEVFGTGTDATTGEKVGTQLAGDIEAKIDVIDGYHDVPSADAVTNTQMRDVVGNKTDAAAAGAVSATESLMAYAKQAVTQLGTDADTDPIGQVLWGSGGITTYPAAAAAANGVSMAEVLRYISEQQVPRIATFTQADLTAATAWTTGNSPVTIFTVTGDVLVQVFARITTQITTTLNNGTLEAGVVGDTASLLVQDTADGTAFDAGDVWTLISAADDSSGQLADEWAFVGNGADIVVTIGTNSVTAGGIIVYCRYIPISSGASVVSA